MRPAGLLISQLPSTEWVAYVLELEAACPVKLRRDRVTKDCYDAAYESGYQDGLAGRPAKPPTDDSEINYRDGYEDGRFKREQDHDRYEPGWVYRSGDPAPYRKERGA